MALSSARLLLDFFEAETAMQQQRYKLTSLIAAVADIEAHLPLWEAQRHDVQAFRDSIPAWLAEILRHTAKNGVIISPGSSIEKGDLGVLRWAASLLEADTPSLSEDDRTKVREMVGAARGVLRGDESLPESLRLHIATLLLHVESVLDNFDIMGDFALEDAVERLLGAMRFAEDASTSKPNAWGKFYSDWLQPVATAIMGGGPNTALAITSMLGG